MPKRSKKSKYPSRYVAGGWVSAPQYATELACEAKARSENKELPLNFWEIESWAKYFKSQIPAANKLLKKYSEEAVIKALLSSKGKKIYSLRAPWLIDLIEEEQKKVDNKAAAIEQVEVKEYEEIVQMDFTASVLKRLAPKGVLSKLRELDG